MDRVANELPVLGFAVLYLSRGLDWFIVVEWSPSFWGRKNEMSYFSG